MVYTVNSIKQDSIPTIEPGKSAIINITIDGSSDYIKANSRLEAHAPEHTTILHMAYSHDILHISSDGHTKELRVSEGGGAGWSRDQTVTLKVDESAEPGVLLEKNGSYACLDENGKQLAHFRRL